VRSDHDACLLVGHVDFVDSVDEAGVSECEIFLDGKVPVFLHSVAHNFLQTGVDDVDFVGSVKLRLIGIESHDLEKLVLGLLFVLLGHLSGGDVIEILEPFEVGAGDTTSVHKHVGSANNTTAGENLFGSVGSRSVSTFVNGLHLEIVGVTFVDGLFSGSGDQTISGLGHERERVTTVLFSSSREALE